MILFNIIINNEILMMCVTNVKQYYNIIINDNININMCNINGYYY